MVTYTLPEGKGWHDIHVKVTVEKATSLLRIHLAGGKTMEIQSIRWSANGSPLKEWDFSKQAP